MSRKKEVDLRQCIAEGHDYKSSHCYQYDIHTYSIDFICTRCDFETTKQFRDEPSVKKIEAFLALKP